MQFYVQGSAQKPYSVRFMGEGDSLAVYCSCPAGRKAAMFCKHAAALLVGDVTALITEMSDDVENLRTAAAGSPLMERAMLHNPKPKPSSSKGVDLIHANTGSIAEALNSEVATLEQDGWRVVSTAESLAVFGWYKNGKPRKGPSAAIFWCGDDREFDGLIYAGNKVRPFYVGGRTYKYLSMALLEFYKHVNANRQKHLPVPVA